MTAIVARQPLHPLPMSSTQRPPRRLSARLQEKDAALEEYSDPTKPALTSRKAQTTEAAVVTNGTKRKNTYDEEDDGFMFTRVKKSKQKNPQPIPAVPAEPATDRSRTSPAGTTRGDAPAANSGNVKPPKKKPPKMSFSTPNPWETEQQPLRRSKRLSSENEAHGTSPLPKARRKDDPAMEKAEPARRLISPEKKRDPPRPDVTHAQHTEPETEQDHSATKIALPFADTPVIKRNKAMRENKSGKGERRSSLGLRGRRASSLIESGNSNALPHSEVEVSDFYKHIESDGLPEPRRMRQLLTWCATRCLDQKAFGAEFEDSSARTAARAIEEELLKDLANRSELSDWFSREDIPELPKEIPERPNPKNRQNVEKITELEDQIKRLRSERDALEALLRPPAIPSLPECSVSNIDKALLNDSDSAILSSLTSRTSIWEETSCRINSLQTSLGPSIDAFADGIHKVAQYRNAADTIAATVLNVCSRKLTEREQEGRMKALADENRSPRRDLNSVLRGLSRIDR